MTIAATLSTKDLSQVRPFWMNSKLSSQRVADYCDTLPFERFGTWGDKVQVAKPGSMISLVHWLAVHRREAASFDDLWTICKVQNDHLFAEFQIVRLDQPSFFLPRGEVVFGVAKNPSQIPDNPPQGVLLRRWEAMEQHPCATHFFLEPVFTFTPHAELYTGSAVREDAAWDKLDAIFAARLYGPILRSAQLSWDVGRFGASLALGAYVRARDAVNEAWYRHATRRLRRQARLRTNPRSATEVTDEELWQQEKLRLRLRREMAHWTKIDPVLCFSLPERPDELRFIAHWYHGVDRKTYMHV